jgi:hypothetical protein
MFKHLIMAEMLFSLNFKNILMNKAKKDPSGIKIIILIIFIEILNPLQNINMLKDFFPIQIDPRLKNSLLLETLKSSPPMFLLTNIE